MAEPQEIKENNPESRFTSPAQDLAILVFLVIFVLILSYFFNVFIFLVEFFQKHPQSITWIDEIISGLLTLSIGFAIFSWRRWLELKKETAERIRLEEELVKNTEARAETERIICKGLHLEIEEYRKILSRESQAKEQPKQE